MDWMCCNNCGFTAKNNRNNFHVTRCGHFFCSVCIEKAVEKCSQCKAEGQPSLSLRDPIERSINGCFIPLDDVAQKISQVTLFQSVQWNITNGSHSIDGKYEALKKEYWRLRETLKLHKQKSAKYMTLLNTLRLNVQQLEHKLKTSRNHIPEFSNKKLSDYEVQYRRVAEKPNISRLKFSQISRS